ncbi:UNVERIFIED_CONTAM: hypothetical protein Sindi_1312800 [Sesamum indicum]
MTRVPGSDSTGIVLRLKESQKSRACDDCILDLCYRGICYALESSFTLYKSVATVIAESENEVPMSSNLAQHGYWNRCLQTTLTTVQLLDCALDDNHEINYQCLGLKSFKSRTSRIGIECSMET